jgi:hypothetical protein
MNGESAVGSDTGMALRRAFPRNLGTIVDDAIALIPSTDPLADRIVGRGRVLGPLSIEGETVFIPYRIYAPELVASRGPIASEETKDVIACAYTRHSDGFVRERALRGMGHLDRPWVVPFVVQLLGEYVVEIAEVVVGALDGLSRSTYERFSAENEGFLQLTQQHVTSYWASYYRRSYLLSEYPPVQAMQGLGLWHGEAGRHRLAGERRLRSG